MSKDDFDKAIDATKLPKNMSIETFHEAVNTYLTLKWLWQKCLRQGKRFTVTEENIKSLHGDFMRGLRDDAGFYSDKIRVMGRLQGPGYHLA